MICEQDLDVNDAPCSLSTIQPFSTFIGVGGTSSSAPTFAGMMALVNQNMASQSLSARQGNANYVLYPLFTQQSSLSCNSSSSPNSGCTFYDVTLGNNSVPCTGQSLDCSSTANPGIYGLLEQVNSSGTPTGSLAWGAGAGYDLATGLGTINATNLITKWATAAGKFTPTTTTLCLVSGSVTTPTCSPSPAPISITHGTTVSGSISVSPSPGTSTLEKPEDAALIGVFNGGATAAVDHFDVNANPLNSDIYPLSGGKISGAMTSELIGGTYMVHAHYAGDGTFGSSDSSPISVTVAPENSTTTITSDVVNPNTGSVSAASGAPYGTLDLVRVDVVGATSHQESATGAVTLTDNAGAIVGPTGSAVASFNLNAEGYLEDQTPFLAVGSHSFVANYAGDLSYNASASGAAAFTVTQATTATSLGATVSDVASGGRVTLTAFVDTSSIGNAPTDSVTFKSGGTAILGAIPLTATTDQYGFSAGIASFTYSPSATSAYTAVYSGDANYVTSTSTAVTVSVGVPGVTLLSANVANPINISSPGKTGQTIVTISSVNPLTASLSVNLSCTVSSASGATVEEGPSCSPASNSVTLSAAQMSAPVTFTISTTAFVSSLTGPAGRSNDLGWFSMGASALLACIFLVAVPGQKRRGTAWLVLLLAVVATAAFACGGGPSSGSGGSGSSGGNSANPGTTVGQYTVTVSATPAGGAAQSIQIPLNVQ